MKDQLDRDFFRELYNGFAMPLCNIDCGSKCGPHNECGVPLCCDIQQVIPAAFGMEWDYLEENSDLWKPWTSSGQLNQELQEELQEGQVLLECKGYRECQRDFRTMTCRAFPFYPYLNSEFEFRGMSYYPDFRSGCWIISNLEVVSQSYKEAFQHTYLRLFEAFPESHHNFSDFSRYMRDKAVEASEKVILLDFLGDAYAIDPRTEDEYQVEYKELSAFGPFEIARELRFPDE
jgi:hypothetical protein